MTHCFQEMDGDSLLCPVLHSLCTHFLLPILPLFPSPKPPPLQLRREKIDLENTLEQEQEMLVNKLWKKMDRVEAEKRWVCG